MHKKGDTPFLEDFSPFEKTKKIPPGEPGGISVSSCGAVHKPNSVPEGGDHFSTHAVTDGLEQPTRAPSPKAKRPDRSKGRCLALHAVGLAMPGLSPARRCALTAPFQPYLCPASRAIGGMFSVALSRVAVKRRVGVTHHRVLSCSDFPPARKGRAVAAPTPHSRII